ncbi:MAG: helix-turn-helix domain-containing protein [Bacilli bacterium]|nr:helix-turn-helix domain-containing protein [Bacilli bacterium]
MRKVKYAEMGSRIRQARIQKGLKQKDCLEPLGDITPQMLSDWEKGYVCPSLNYLVNIAKFFDTSLDYLVLGVNNDPKDTAIHNLKGIAVYMVELVNSGLFRFMEYTDIGKVEKVGIEATNTYIIRFKREFEKLLNASETLGPALFKQAVLELVQKYDIPLKQ